MAQCLEAEEDRGEGLVDLVVEVAGEAAPLLLLRAQDEPAAPPSLGVDSLEHAAEGRGQAVDLLGLLRGRRVVELGGLSRVDGLDALDQLLERREPPPQHEQVDEQDEDRRHGEQQELPPLAGDGQVQARGRAREEQRGTDQEHVHGHDLADQGCGFAPELHGNGVLTPYRHETGVPTMWMKS